MTNKILIYVECISVAYILSQLTAKRGFYKYIYVHIVRTYIGYVDMILVPFSVSFLMMWQWAVNMEFNILYKLFRGSRDIYSVCIFSPRFLSVSFQVSSSHFALGFVFNKCWSAFYTTQKIHWQPKKQKKKKIKRRRRQRRPGVARILLKFSKCNWMRVREIERDRSRITWITPNGVEYMVHKNMPNSDESRVSER